MVSRSGGLAMARPRPLQTASFANATAGLLSPSKSAPRSPLLPEKKKSGGQEPKEPLSKQLARFKEYQTGFDLATGGYRVLSSIAAGTQGDVFQAVTSTSTFASIPLLQARTEVAVKRARNTNQAIQRHVVQEFAAVFYARDRYAAEIKDSNAAGHPNIVGYLDWFAGPLGSDREVWLVMEKCDFALNDVLYTALQARSLYERRFAEMVKQQGPPPGVLVQKDLAAKRPVLVAEPMLYRFPEHEVVKVVLQMLTALAFLNRHGVLHRDVKTENILWVLNNDEGSYKLADFGTAAVLADGETARKDQDCGTLWTMSPEVIGRRYHSFNCDVWSLACVTFEVATLERPFNSKELLAHKNSQDAVNEGSFWPALCASLPSTGGASGAGVPVGSSGAVQASRARFGEPISPLPKRAASPTLGKREKGIARSLSNGGPNPLSPKTPKKSVVRQASLPTLQLAGRAAPPSPAGSTTGSKRSLAPRLDGLDGRSPMSSSRGIPAAAADKTDTDCSLPPLSSIPASPAASSSAQRPGSEGGVDSTDGPRVAAASAGKHKATPRSGVGLGNSTAQGDEAPQSPKSPGSPPVMSDRKRRFLRKRCNGRWGYSDDLRTLIFEDMLEEDALRRPAAADLLENHSRAMKLFVRHELVQVSAADGDESYSGVAPMPVSALMAANQPSTHEQTSVGGQEGSGITSHLRIVTPEAFLRAVRAEKERLMESKEITETMTGPP